MENTGRRKFLASTAGGLGLSPLLTRLPLLQAEDVEFRQDVVRLSSEIEPLVQFLESTPRDRIIEETASKVQQGLSYRRLLAALLLAGVRNVQPRPSVGFKFHAVLVVNSAHLASLSSSEQDRWLPIFWAIDNFKSSQARDVREGNWTMAPVDETRVPPAHLAADMLARALEDWDEEAADLAATGMVRERGSHEVFALLAKYAARDFRSIGHKVIYLSNAFRTLQTIGWGYAEPVIRSLVYAMLNHEGQPNPSTSDLEPDRAGRRNWELVRSLPKQWQAAEPDDSATRDLIQTLRTCNPDEASDKIAELISGGANVQSIWDGLFCSASELLMRQRGIISLHAVTTTNAIHHAFKEAAADETRQYLLLQNAAFLPMFRDEAAQRGKLASRQIEDLQAETSENPSSVPEMFELLGSNRGQASQQIFGYLEQGGDPQTIIDHARRLVFLKGNDSHDYKFSSAALEDFRAISPSWRSHYLAASAYQLRAATEKTRPLAERIADTLRS